MLNTPRKTYKREDVILDEKRLLEERRRRLFGERAPALEDSLFGIALSGGGIRSATINLGFLKVLNACGILKKADYLSSVSGGGYTASYIQAKLKKEGSYEALFSGRDLHHLRSYGNYLVPGQSTWSKLWNGLVLGVAYVYSWAMSMISPVLLIIVVLATYRLFDLLSHGKWFKSDAAEWYGTSVLPKLLLVLGVLGLVHLLANLVAKYALGVSRRFNQFEAFAVVLGLFFSLPVLLSRLSPNAILPGLPWEVLQDRPSLYLLIIFGAILLGFFLNPNALSFHRFYRNQLAEAFLRGAGDKRNMLLKDLYKQDGDKSNWMNPYPLINTCLNLQNPSGDDKFKGAKASDYFLLSPRFCGSKLSGYVETATYPGYSKMTLPAATTISAAAANPGMGIYSNKFLSVLMTLFNLRLGYWVNNPLKKKSPYIVWWPFYFFYELLGKIGTGNHKLNISDGGHIENLAVYELLRRRCRLIIAVDAGADPDFTFADLQNLTIRARNELGVDIRFREGENPEDIIRPRPSTGYSQRRFAVADLYRIWDELPLTGEAGETITAADGRPLEILVNYMPDGSWNPWITIKGDMSGFSNEQRRALYARAQEIVEAHLDGLPGAVGPEKVKFGVLVYVKSSVTAPTLKPNISPKKRSEAADEVSAPDSYDTYKYKIYHPNFPHEPTSDQFFDPVQWESYFKLGQFIAVDVLGLSSQQYVRLLKQRRGFPQWDYEDLFARFGASLPSVKPTEVWEEAPPITRGEEEMVEPEVAPPPPPVTKPDAEAVRPEKAAAKKVRVSPPAQEESGLTGEIPVLPPDEEDLGYSM